MNEKLPELTLKELSRANKSLRAAKTLLKDELYEDCVSRAYYAVFHATKAALYSVGVKVQTHKGVKIMFSLHFVKTEKIEKEFAKILGAGKEEREIADYEVDFEIVEQNAKQRVDDAEKFVKRIEQYLETLK